MLRPLLALILVPGSFVALAAMGLAEPRSTTSVNAKDRMICHRIVETGKLVATRRMCLTSAEWEDLAKRTRQNWRDPAGSCRWAAEQPMKCLLQGQ